MIKNCGLEHIDQVIALGQSWAQELEIEDYQEECWRQAVRNYGIYQHLRLLVLTDTWDTVQGFMAGAVSPAPHSGEVTAQIHYAWIRPEQADFQTFLELHSAFESWAREAGATMILKPSAYEIRGPQEDWFHDLNYREHARISVRKVQ